MMYAYATFHAFADGNKRTALMTTDFFLFLNQYDFELTSDAPEFTRDLTNRCLDKPHSSIDEIRKPHHGWPKEQDHFRVVHHECSTPFF